MQYQFRFLLIVTIFISLVSTVHAANIVASLDRNQVSLDESFRVVFKADDAVDDDPDFDPLRNDFQILSQSKSTNMSFVNGQYSRQGVWSLELMAKQTGNLIIPSVSFGKDRSPALRIQISDPATAQKPSGKQNDDVFLQVEVDRERAWVQSQIIVSVRLFTRISMHSLRSSEALTSDPDTIINQLGSTSYEAFRNGVRYAVHQVRYAIFPQHSGKLEFKPMIFEGRINRGGPQSFMDQFLNAGEVKRVRSKSVQIDVLAKPDHIKPSDWLPAKSVTLIEEWSADTRKLKSGEPVTRTITINVDGVPAENLPDLNMPEIDGLKQYPDKAIPDNKATDQGISSSKQIKIALIPTHAGNFKLPAISIPWWNTETGKLEVAKLPGKLIRASGEAANKKTDTVNKIATPSKPQKDSSTKPETMPQPASAGYWPWLSLALGVGWLVTLIALFHKKTKATTGRKEKTSQPPLRALEKSVYKHARKNDRNQTKNALLKWANARWPERTISNLVDICNVVSDELASEIENLNTALYSPAAAQWSGESLINAFKVFHEQKTKPAASEDDPLEPLYKA